VRALTQSFRKTQRLPNWFVIRPVPEAFHDVQLALRKHGLRSICEEAHCPNLPECWGEAKTATFLLMGDVCTRTCKFCYVKSGKPVPLDPTEPSRLADAVEESGFDYVVLTSVNRDDLPDGGAGHFAQCVRAIKERKSSVLVEVLIPDFKQDENALQTIIDARPDVIAHNLETVRRLQKTARDFRASYGQSLDVLRFVKEKQPNAYTKTSLMLGMGETADELVETFTDLRAAGVSILTLGQYLQPSAYHLPVVEYVHPDAFRKLREVALGKGFVFVAAGPFVRSSYRAAEVFVKSVRHASLSC